MLHSYFKIIDGYIQEENETLLQLLVKITGLSGNDLRRASVKLRPINNVEESLDIKEEQLNELASEYISRGIYINKKMFVNVLVK